MKVLWLGNSTDQRGRIADTDMRSNVVAHELEAATGEPVEMVVRSIWPNERLVGLVERWMDEEAPDIVMLRTVAFWFNYESVPLRVDRLLGPLGKPLKNAGMGMAKSSWIGERAIFHWLRRWTLRLIGGDTYFTPDEVIERQSAAIRAIVRREGVGLVAYLPKARTDYYPSAKAKARAEARRRKVHDALAQLCEELHVPYLGSVQPRYLTEKATTVGDRLHPDAEEHRRRASEELPYVLEAWRQVQG
jgi:hypothetical protein